MTTLADLEARVAALEEQGGRSGPLSGWEAWRPFFTGRAKYDPRGVQLLMETEDSDGATLVWLTGFERDPFGVLQPVPAGVIQGKRVNGEMRLSMTATQNMEEHYDGSPQGAYGLVEAGSFDDAGASAWLQAQTDASGIEAVIRAYAGDNIAACQVIGTFHLKRTLQPASLAANANDYAPAGIHYSSVLELQASTPVNITGIVNVVDDGAGQDAHVGRILVVVNVGGNNITLVTASAASAEANRFAFTGNVVLAPNAAATLYYSAASSRWYQIG